MTTDLHIALLQSPLVWENPAANRAHFETGITGLTGPIDLIVLPEMFTTGFSMAPERVAEEYAVDCETLRWMRTMAFQTDAVVCGSISAREDEKHYNRLLWVRPDGTTDIYDKRHLFTFAGEDGHYTAGIERKVFELKGWRICPLICYDLRFPVWSRNRLSNGRADYDLLLYVANWPAVRRDPWQKLLFARAIENLCYVAAVNRTGTDANGHAYAGDSVVIGPRGEVMAEADPGAETVVRVALEKNALDDFRSKFPALGDADDFRL